jgi:putative sigma-54 modulation protein
MEIKIKATNMELTEAIRDYAEKKVDSLSKFIQGTSVIADIEVGKTTNHHKNGDVFKAEINIISGGDKFFVNSERDDLYAAIDDAREAMYRELISNKDRSDTLFRRGARSVKKMLKGLSSRNPFTSK